MTKRTRNSKLVASLLCATSLIGAFYATPALAAQGDVKYDGTSAALTYDNSGSSGSSAESITTITIGNTTITTDGLSIDGGNGTKLENGKLTIKTGTDSWDETNGIKASKAAIDGTLSVTDEVTGKSFAAGINGTKLENGKLTIKTGTDSWDETDGIKASKAAIDGTLSVTDEVTGKSFAAGINGTKLENGKLTIKTGTDSWDETDGIKASKAAIDGTLSVTDEVTGKSFAAGINGTKLENGKLTIKTGTDSWDETDGIKASKAAIDGTLSVTDEAKVGSLKVNEGNAWDSTSLKASKVEVTDTLTVKGDAGIEAKKFNVNENNYLDENGLTASKASIKGDATIDGDVTVDKKLTVNGTAGIEAKKYVAGSSSLADGELIADTDNKLTTTGLTASKANIAGNATIDGKTTTDSLEVTNDATINGKLDVNGEDGIKTTKLDVTKDANIRGKLDVTGAVTGASFAAGTTNGTKLEDGKLTISGTDSWDKTDGIKASKATIGGSLDVSGDTALKNTSVNGTLGVTGNTTIGGTLGVTGDTTLRNTTIDGGDLKVTTGIATFGGTSGNQTTIEGGKLTVSTSAIIGTSTTIDTSGIQTNKLTTKVLDVTNEISVPTLNVTKNLNVTDTLTVGSKATINGVVIGEEANAINATTYKAGSSSFKQGELLVDANNFLSTANGLKTSAATIANDAAIGGELNVTKDATIGGELNVTKDATIGGNFDVTGNTTLKKTTINGDLDAQKITSKVDANNYGTWNGNEFTLSDGTSGYTTELTAGGATFVGQPGEDGETTTTISGGTITTDTLEVSTIKLKKKMVDNAGTTLEISETGSLMAATGKFKVDADGNMTNTTGTTELSTDATNGIKAAAGSTSLEIAKDSITNKVGTDVSSEMTEDSITNNVGTDVSSEMTKDSITNNVGNTTVTTRDDEFSALGTDRNGMKIDTKTGETTFTGNDTTYGSGNQKTTVINGNTITTGKITTDQLVITGQGDADGTGTGTIMLGGDGSITSNINDGTGKETTFQTDIDGITSIVTDGTNIANVITEADEVKTIVDDGTNTANVITKANEVKTVVDDGTNTSNFVITKDSIDTTVTDGTNRADISVEADEITNYIRTADNEELAATSLTKEGLAVAQKGYNDIELGNGDVSIDTSKGDFANKGTLGEIRLSNLGNLDKDLDSELKARSEYTNNQTTVGAVNAEAAARREAIEAEAAARREADETEKAARVDSDIRLGNRIDDLSDRVDKVGAMSAAMASLRTMGYDPNAPSEFAIGLGHYKGKTGVALGLFHHPNRDVMLNFSLSTASGETMGGMGATWKFGHKSPDKLLREQREIEVKKKMIAAQKLAEAQKLAKEAQERAAYAAKVAREAATAARIAQQDADRTAAKFAK